MVGFTFGFEYQLRFVEISVSKYVVAPWTGEYYFGNLSVFAQSIYSLITHTTHFGYIAYIVGRNVYEMN